MIPLILDGKKLSAEIEINLIDRVKRLKDEAGVTPGLATILVGNDPSSEVYVNMKANACRRAGLISEKIILPGNTTTTELLEVIDRLNKSDKISGILLQHPVPRKIDERVCFDAISIEKDVDGVTTPGFGKTAFNLESFKCATPCGIMTLL